MKPDEDLLDLETVHLLRRALVNLLWNRLQLLIQLLKIIIFRINYNFIIYVIIQTFTYETLTFKTLLLKRKERIFKVHK